MVIAFFLYLCTAATVAAFFLRKLTVAQEGLSSRLSLVEIVLRNIDNGQAEERTKMWENEKERRALEENINYDEDGIPIGLLPAKEGV